MQTESIERSLRAALRETLDSEQGPHAAWVGSPAARRVAALKRRGRWPLRGLAVAAVIGTVAGATLLAGTLNKPAPTTAPSPSTPVETNGVLVDIDGWIAYGDDSGIWAIDPARPGDRDRQVQLSSRPGIPKAWSADGSKLLLLRLDEQVLVVLNPDGTETRLAAASGGSGGDFTPDGSQVVYAGEEDGQRTGIYVIAAVGGTPELLLDAGYNPTFSPDGTQIAYFDGSGDSGHSLRVMNSDGTGSRVVLENDVTMGAGHVDGLDWSPDGQRLVFAIDTQGVYVVGIDGSGFVKVSPPDFADANVPGGTDPHWSPDGSLISYNTGVPLSREFDALVIARPDGTGAQELAYGQSGPWKPAGTQPSTPPQPTAPPVEARDAALLGAFLEARVAGEGAERYIDGAEGAIPLLYATTGGTPFERAEFEPVVGYEWPYDWTAFKVRLFAGDAVVEQLVFTTPQDPALIVYKGDGFRTDIPPTIEGGRPPVVGHAAFDGQVTVSYSHPWVALRLIPAGISPTTDGGERNGWVRLELIADPGRFGTGCPAGPPPADAAALADAIQSDPGLEVTGPVAVGAGGAEGLVMDVRMVPGASRACSTLRGDLGTPFSPSLNLATGNRMRLYLFDAPPGLSMRILVIGFAVPESQFERAAAAPISVQFHVP